MFVEGYSGRVQDAAVEETAGGELPLAALEARIGKLAAEINAATCRWLGLVAEFGRRGGHEQHGFASCASWLAWRCGLTPRAAREQVRVAGALEELPAIRAAFAGGRISYSKARALSRAASLELEEELLELAEHASAAQLERILRGFSGAISEDDEAVARERRHLRLEWQEDGGLRISGYLPAEEGALVVEAIETARKALGEDFGDGEATGQGVQELPDGADALVALAEGGLAGELQAASGGERHQVVVHVEAGSLAAARNGAGGVGPAGSPVTVGEAGQISPETARRMACDASIVTLVERDGEPLSIGRKTRSIPPAIARALRARDAGCRFPGCECRRYVDAHHIEHWAHGGETSLDNLVQLCRRHHRLIHEGRFGVESGSEGLVFRRADGSVLEQAPTSASDPGRRPRSRSQAPPGSGESNTADPGPAPSDGRIDYGLTVAGLARLAGMRSG